MSRRKYERATRYSETVKKEDYLYVPGVLGFPLEGVNKVEVPSRPGYVYVRVRGSLSEVVQAYNDEVAPVYDLPVLIIRDDVDKTRYRVFGRDTGAYENWGSSSPYLPKHGHTHSFIPEEGGGGDVVWAYSRQLMPLAVYPSGSLGAGMVLIKPSTYYQNNVWHYAGGTATSSLLPYKPIDNTARMVLVYLDGDGNPQLLGGTDYFAATITGASAIVPYLPSVAATDDIPLEAIRLVSGTSEIIWTNIYDVRPWIIGDGFINTGTFAPSDGSYVTMTAEPSLSSERVLTAGDKITIDDIPTGSSVTVGITTGTINGVIGFFVAGELSTGTIAVRNLAPRAGTFQNSTASIFYSPTGSNVIADVHKNGTTIFTNQSNRPTIVPGTFHDLTAVPDVQNFNQNDEFIMYIDAIGVSGSGADLQVQLRYSV